VRAAAEVEDDGLSVGADSCVGVAVVGEAPGLCRGLLLIRQDPVYRLTWTLVSPAPGPLMRAPSPLETTLSQSESLSL
jgi:hypothetical protein